MAILSGGDCILKAILSGVLCAILLFTLVCAILVYSDGYSLSCAVLRCNALRV